MGKSFLYTATGDGGTTSLVGGSRVSKDDDRIEAYGAIDELNSHMGLLGSMIKEKHDDVYRKIVTIQHRLFDIGAALATPSGKDGIATAGVSEEKIKELERWIDETDGELPELRNFVLPGGTEKSAVAQIARTVCRRAERRIVSLSKKEPVESGIIVYVNRLSDYLFALARYLNVSEGAQEIVWTKGT